MNEKLEIRLAENAWHGDTTFYELVSLGDVLSIDEHDDVKFPEEVILLIGENEYAYILKTAEKCKWELAHSGTLYDKWRCSCCGYEFVEPRTDQGYTELEPKFCPNCGREVEA